MKTLTAITVAAALFGGVTIAGAQNATPTTKVSPSPSSINTGSDRPTVPSGAEAPAAAAGQRAHVSGAGKFCKPSAANRLHCLYASANACERHNVANNLRCVANPKLGRKF